MKNTIREMLKSDISGYHSGAAEDGSLLRYIKVMLRVQLPTFRRIVV
jgi:hypothetical protein